MFHIVDGEVKVWSSDKTTLLLGSKDYWKEFSSWQFELSSSVEQKILCCFRHVPHKGSNLYLLIWKSDIFALFAWMTCEGGEGDNCADSQMTDPDKFRIQRRAQQSNWHPPMSTPYFFNEEQWQINMNTKTSVIWIEASCQSCQYVWPFFDTMLSVSLLGNRICWKILFIKNKCYQVRKKIPAWFVRLLESVCAVRKYATSGRESSVSKLRSRIEVNFWMTAINIY